MPDLRALILTEVDRTARFADGTAWSSTVAALRVAVVTHGCAYCFRPTSCRLLRAVAEALGITPGGDRG